MSALPVHTRTIEELVIPGQRLGRHVQHDPASRAYGVVVAAAQPLVRVTHTRHGGLFNQLDLGSCTGNALTGAANCAPLYAARLAKHPTVHILHEKDAVATYVLATSLDDVPGQYPPDDTGSSGLAACKAGVQLGYIGAYQHAFSVDAALQALQASAVITGVDWYEGFDHPSPDGLVAIAGQVRGGHEFVVRSYAPQHTNTYLDDIVGADNSWGTAWAKHGHFYFTVRTWAMLLHSQGDCTVPLP